MKILRLLNRCQDQRTSQYLLGVDSLAFLYGEVFKFPEEFSLENFQCWDNSDPKVFLSVGCKYHNIRRPNTNVRDGRCQFGFVCFFFFISFETLANRTATLFEVGKPRYWWLLLQSQQHWSNSAFLHLYHPPGSGVPESLELQLPSECPQQRAGASPNL